MAKTNKGFIKDWAGNTILPITRGELVLDANGNMALASDLFLAGEHRDANGNPLPGLVTHLERTLISQLSGDAIGNVSKELTAINNGLIFNGTPVKFYDTDLNATPININAPSISGINLGVANNVVTFALAEVNSTDISKNNAGFLKNITIDKYGRVTAVTASDITNEDLPQTITRNISNSVITNSTLTGCSTTEDPTTDYALANKAYVDAKFSAITGTSLGALIFGGPLSTAEAASTALANPANNNKYYKVTSPFVINTSDLYETSGVAGTTLTVKLGDTLIITKLGTSARFVYVPSGDETLTTVSVTTKTDTTYPYNSKTGNVILRFSELFKVTTPAADSSIADITMLQASVSQGGYLSKDDYNRFNGYASKSVTYTPNAEISALSNKYLIGTLKLDSTEHNIYGVNNVSSLSLVQNNNSNVNPIIKFTETGQNDVNITIKGSSGIGVNKNGNNVEITASHGVVNGANNSYLSMNSNYKFDVKIGEIDSNGALIEGLTKYSEFSTFRDLIGISGVAFDLLEGSLKDSSYEYKYGSIKLKSAVTLTI